MTHRGSLRVPSPHDGDGQHDQHDAEHGEHQSGQGGRDTLQAVRETEAREVGVRRAGARRPAGAAAASAPSGAGWAARTLTSSCARGATTAHHDAPTWTPCRSAPAGRISQTGTGASSTISPITRARTVGSGDVGEAAAPTASASTTAPVSRPRRSSPAPSATTSSRATARMPTARRSCAPVTTRPGAWPSTVQPGTASSKTVRREGSTALIVAPADVAVPGRAASVRHPRRRPSPR